jgi:hypothetical protein
MIVMTHRWPRITHTKAARTRKRQRANAESSARYFTDGTNLFRFIGWLARSETSKLAVVEDCRSLAILVVTAERLDTHELRPV